MTDESPDTERDDHLEGRPIRRSVSPAFPRSAIDRTDLNISRSLRALGDAQAQLGGGIARLLATAGVFSAAERARAGVLASAQVPALRAVEGLAQLSTGSSLVSGTFAAQLAGARFESLTSLASPAFKALHEGLFADLSRTSRFVEQQTALLAAMRPQVEIARSVSFANRAWEHVVGSSRPNLDVSLNHLRMVGRGTAGAIEAGVLLTEPDDIVVERFRAEADHEIGPSVASDALRDRLALLHPDLPNRLQGAWERIHEGGADAASQAANSLMEAIDWTLRTLAPDDEVLAWHAAENLSTAELHQGKPTRPLRIRYAVRLSSEKRRALTLYLRTIEELIPVIQSPKHAIDTRAAEALASTAMTVEGFLYYLVVD